MNNLPYSAVEKLRFILKVRNGDDGYTSDETETESDKEFGEAMRVAYPHLSRKRPSPDEELLYKQLVADPKRIKKITEMEKKAANRLKNIKMLQETYEQLSKLFEENDRKPIEFYKLVIDPKNFVKSLEYYLLLVALVHQNRIIVEDDTAGYPHVWVLTAEETNAAEEEGKLCKSIKIFNKELCKEYERIYAIEKPLLYLVDSGDEEED